MKILLMQLDGKLPNIALMRIAAHHRERGDEVELRHSRHSVRRYLWDKFDHIYASLIFEKTRPLALQLKEEYPKAIIGGTGWDEKVTVEQYGITTKRQDYTDYPSFCQSLGFTQRGCRFSCHFCKVPQAEGKVRKEQTVLDIWRGDPWPKEILLLDNDFFGQPHWREEIRLLREHKFKVSFNQGINARVLSDEAAESITSVDYRDDSMTRKRIYTAWDNIGDEGPLFRGLKALVKYGVKPDDIMVYMLLENQEIGPADLHRHTRLREFGCRPYPMPFARTKETVGFQRWVVRAADKKCSWEQWKSLGFRADSKSIRPS